MGRTEETGGGKQEGMEEKERRSLPFYITGTGTKTSSGIDRGKCWKVGGRPWRARIASL